jgi:hypothetical protein
MSATDEPGTTQREIERVVAAAKLAGREEGSLMVFDHEVIFRWGASVEKYSPDPTGPGIWPGPPAFRWGMDGTPPQVGLLSLRSLVRMFMRVLPGYEMHPLLVLPENSFVRMSRADLPSPYVQRFDGQPHLLDGRVEVRYHLEGGWETAFQIPDGPAFNLKWTRLWRALKEGTIVTTS